jgi:hypothetical protein
MSVSEPLGRNQLIGLGIVSIPFIIATVSLFLGRTDFTGWAGFVQFLVPTGLGGILGLGAAVKILSKPNE